MSAEDSYLVREGTRLLPDIRMPPTATDEGIRAAEHLAAAHPDVGVVVLSQYVEPEYALRLFDGGAHGRAYLLKERFADLRELRRAVEEVLRGGTMLDPLVVDAFVAARQRKQESLLAGHHPHVLPVG